MKFHLHLICKNLVHNSTYNGTSKSSTITINWSLTANCLSVCQEMKSWLWFADIYKTGQFYQVMYLHFGTHFQGQKYLGESNESFFRLKCGKAETNLVSYPVCSLPEPGDLFEQKLTDLSYFGDRFCMLSWSSWSAEDEFRVRLIKRHCHRYICILVTNLGILIHVTCKTCY